MKIEADKWVVIDYTLKNDAGEVVDSSVGSEPLGYLHGNGFIIPGLEKELEGKDAGDKFSAVIKPEDAYGERDEALVMKVPKDRFEGVDHLEIGMNFQVQTPQGPIIVRIIELGDEVTIDGNHEMAGKTLHFEIEVKEVRNATEEELNLKNAMGGGCGNCGGGCGGDCGSGGCGSGGCGNCNG